VDTGVEGTAQKRLDLIPELYRVLGPHMHLIGFRIAPCLDDREMVGSAYLLQNDVGNQTCILFGRRGLGAKQSPRIFLGMRHIRIGLDVHMADDDSLNHPAQAQVSRNRNENAWDHVNLTSDCSWQDASAKERSGRGAGYCPISCSLAAASVVAQPRESEIQQLDAGLSQLPVSRWRERIGDPNIADGILDRLVHNAHRIEMRGESMRKKRNPPQDEKNE
jgi:hypothetical protein